MGNDIYIARDVQISKNFIHNNLSGFFAFAPAQSTGLLYALLYNWRWALKITDADIISLTSF